ncbi:MAG: hypothetical protein ACYYK0_06425 [Candidatus Eutrophobiaceae bacterium]
MKKNSPLARQALAFSLLLCPLLPNASEPGEYYELPTTRSSATLPPSLVAYETKARRLMEELAVSTEANDALKIQARNLVNAGIVAVNAVQPHMPQCNAYFEATRQLDGVLDEISLKSLENGYHQDGALPKSAPECYHPKDLIVHAATVVVLLRDDTQLSASTRRQIRDEIAEVLSHLQVTAAWL